MKLYQKQHWAIWFQAGKDPAFMPHESWARSYPTQYDGQPSHPLLFSTRKQAREWAAKQSAKATIHSGQHRWKYRVLRCTQTITSP